MNYQLEDVFIPGGQPDVTYVEREEKNYEREVARALATPNQIVSIAAPTKTGKTVLCKKILEGRQYVWIDGGRIQTAENFWNLVRDELSLPESKSYNDSSETTLGLEGSIPLISTASGSYLSARGFTENYKIDSMQSTLGLMIKEKLVLVVDDFHYIPDDVRTEIMRNIKGAVFNGLKVLLLSVSHRVFDAIKAETELTGRFTQVGLPPWKKGDLAKIAYLGFEALGVKYQPDLVEKLQEEAQENPMLMQKFCWEACFDNDVRSSGLFVKNEIKPSYELKDMFRRIAHDAGLPIYKKLAAGPQNRKRRESRPLKEGGDADIYEVILRALADTGAKATTKYDELKSAIGDLLSDKIPQKNEITAALKHLIKISRSIQGASSIIDWNEDTREVTIASPYLRFYLKWKIGKDFRI